jgi:serine phosphatase RsbU (regulator of sigma subunit)
MLRWRDATRIEDPRDARSTADDGGVEQPPAPSRFASLRHRLLGLVALVLVPALGLVLYTQADERKVAIANVEADALRLIHIVTSNQAAQIEAARQVLATLARLPQLRTADPAQCSAFLAEMLRAYPLYLNIALAAPDGNLVCSAVPLRGAVTAGDRPYFRRVMETQRFVVGDYQIGRITGAAAINYAYPIESSSGTIEAVLIIAQNLSWLTSALGDVALPDDAVLLVTDRNGTLLARVPQADGAVGNVLADKRVLAAIESRPARSVFEMDDAQGVARLWTHAPLIPGHDLHATIGMSKAVAFESIDRRLLRNLIALALVTLVAFAAAWFGAGLMLGQIDALVAAARRLASGDLAARAPVRGRRNEIELFAVAFNRMAQMLQARDRELRAAEERTRAAEVQLAVTRAQLDIAQKIQRSLLPEEPLTIAGARFAGRCIPAVAVGGDYFGYFARDTRVDSLIGDVSGHGLGAALLMAEARSMFIAERLVSSSAAAILARLNDLLYDDLDCSGQFMTACCATFDGATRKLSYANAGHPRPLLLRAGEFRCTCLQCDGMLLGVSKGIEFAEANVTLDVGDVVVFYTDGISEARNDAGELFGVERLESTVMAHRAEEPEALIAAVLAEVERFAGDNGNEDDRTIVAMKVVH